MRSSRPIPSTARRAARDRQAHRRSPGRTTSRRSPASRCPAGSSGSRAAMAGYDLVCTYNWGAMDAVMAHTLFADVYKLPPLVHHEDGFNEDEARAAQAQPQLYRRIALGRARGAGGALAHGSSGSRSTTWDQPRGRVRLIANGIDTARLCRRRRSATRCRAWSSSRASSGSARWPGCARSRTCRALVRAFAGLPERMAAGHRSARGPSARRSSPRRCGSASSTASTCPASSPSPPRRSGCSTVRAVLASASSSRSRWSRRWPPGCAVAAPRVGDVARDGRRAKRAVLCRAGRRSRAGRGARRARRRSRRCAAASARPTAGGRAAEFDEDAMIERYRAVYWGALGRNCASPAIHAARGQASTSRN